MRIGTVAIFSELMFEEEHREKTRPRKGITACIIVDTVLSQTGEDSKKQILRINADGNKYFPRTAWQSHG
jgi:hypothetical protein